MSQEQVLETLANLGFDEIEAKIYFCLAKKGTKKASDICRVLKITKQQFYPSIKQLQGRGLVASTIEHPARFNATPFESVLDLFIREKLEEARRLQLSREDILSNWRNVKLDDEVSAKFTVIKGRAFIFNKIQQLIQDAQSQILAITTVPILAQANDRDIFASTFGQKKKSNVKFRFLVELNERSARIIKSLRKENRTMKMKVEGRTPELCPALFPQMLVRDDEEALFFIKPSTDLTLVEKEDLCLWTDCKAIVGAFAAFFEDLWSNSIDIRERLIEIETGRLIPKSTVISDAETARKKYHQVLEAAKEEIVAITSPKGLAELANELSNLPNLTEKVLTARIMAPIIEDNSDVSSHLPSFCSIKHVPPNYTPTAIIDGRHLFQFTPSSPRDASVDLPLNFEKLLYVTDPGYIQKTREMLLEIWRNSSAPSVSNLKSILGSEARSQSAYFPGLIRAPGPNGTFHPLPPSDPTKEGSYSVITIVDEDPLKKLKEQDVLNEFIDAQRSPAKNKRSESSKVYSSQAIAVIHPPDFFKLPSMLVRIHHIEKHSTFGAEDAVIINLWLEILGRPAYVPVAVLSDRIDAQTVWGRHFGATPAGRNIQVAKRDELQVLVHGNTLFAGWTAPIHLLPSEYVLPPACILVEGYGNAKTEAYSVIQPTGGKLTAKQNGFDAFVTFMHPSSKYTGPGTDGFFVRDYVMELSSQFIEGFHPQLETKLVQKGDKK